MLLRPKVVSTLGKSNRRQVSTAVPNPEDFEDSEDEEEDAEEEIVEEEVEEEDENGEENTSQIDAATAEMSESQIALLSTGLITP